MALTTTQDPPTAAEASDLSSALGDYDLPTFSGVVVNALDRLRNPKADANEVSNILEADPGVTVRLLGIANSACYGLYRTVNSASHAIALLGRDQVEALLLGVAVSTALPKDPIPHLKTSEFWCGAARRATIARGLAARIDRSHTRESFTSALLQDMAVPLLAKVHQQRYGAILENWRHEQIDLAELERAQFGWDHSMVGAWMGEQWGFSDRAIRAIAAHHGIWDETELPAVTLVSPLTDMPRDYGEEKFIASVCERYEIPRNDLKSLMSESEDAAATMAQMFV